MNTLIWFTNNLRTIDNEALTEAAKTDGKVKAIYFFDPRQFETTDFGFPKTGAYRAQFLIETVADLKKQLHELHIPLYIFHSKPESVLPDFVEAHSIKQIYLQKEWTSEELSVVKACKAGIQQNVSWNEYYDQFLFHPEDIPFDDFNSIPKVFTHFRKKCEKYCEVRHAAPRPAKLPKSNFIDPNSEVPSLDMLGLNSFERDERSAFPFKGGEKAAWDRVHQYFWVTKQLRTYKQTRNGLIGTEYSSKLSAWLANGSISARSIYWEIKDFESEIEKNQDTYWLFFELMWRDFFKYI